MDERRLLALALAQHGLATRRQVLSLGGSDQLIHRRISDGRWDRARRGVLIIGAAPRTWTQDVLGACLAAGDGVAASHRTAARLWGLVPRSGQIQVTAAGGRQVRLAGVACHRSVVLSGLDRTSIDAIPVTTVARTIVDLAPGHEERVIGGWIDAALRAGNLDLLALASCVARLDGPGRSKIDALRVALARRRPGHDPGDSDLEVRALRVLDAAGLPRPVQQHRVVRPDGSPAFIDLAYPEHLVAIEVDGWDVHRGRMAFDQDRLRGNDLVAIGWRVVRYTSAMPDAQFVRVLRALVAPRIPFSSDR